MKNTTSAARQYRPTGIRLSQLRGRYIGAGSSCGANISDRLTSAIGSERQYNPALLFTDEAAFVEWVITGAPPAPRYYPRMKKGNAQGPEVLADVLRRAVPRNVAPALV